MAVVTVCSAVMSSQLCLLLGNSTPPLVSMLSTELEKKKKKTFTTVRLLNCHLEQRVLEESDDTYHHTRGSDTIYCDTIVTTIY